MSDRVLCEFFLIRYVPNVVREEFVNIGVIIRQIRPDGDGPADDAVVLKLTRDWARVRCFDPDADIQLLEGLEAELTSRLGEGSHATDTFLAKLRDTLSNSIQISEPRASLAQTPAIKLDQLMTIYVEG